MRRHSLPSVTVGFKIVCVLFWPCCYISSSHKHWQLQFTQKHTEEWCKWFVTSKRKRPGRLLAKEPGLGAQTEEAALLLLLRAVQVNLIICLSCQQTQRKIATQNRTAKVGYSWEQRLDLSAMPYLCYQPVSHHRLAKCLLLSALTGPLWAPAERLCASCCDGRAVKVLVMTYSGKIV